MHTPQTHTAHHHRTRLADLAWLLRCAFGTLQTRGASRTVARCCWTMMADAVCASSPAATAQAHARAGRPESEKTGTASGRRERHHETIVTHLPQHKREREEQAKPLRSTKTKSQDTNQFHFSLVGLQSRRRVHERHHKTTAQVLIHRVHGSSRDSATHTTMQQPRADVSIHQCAPIGK